MTDFGWNEATQRKKASIELNNGNFSFFVFIPYALLDEFVCFT
jgi:hypothetical protein